MPVGWLLGEGMAWKVCEAEQPEMEGADGAGLPVGGRGGGARGPQASLGPCFACSDWIQESEIPCGRRTGVPPGRG